MNIKSDLHVCKVLYRIFIRAEPWVCVGVEGVCVVMAKIQNHHLREEIPGPALLVDGHSDHFCVLSTYSVMLQQY